MGAWGNQLFQDDTACDVRDEYKGLLADGQAGPAATDQLLDRWKDTVADDDEGPVFWLALAATQHKLGRLEPRVKDHAFAVLDQGLGLDRWREIGAHSVRGRQAALEKVRQQLLSPQPAEKRFGPRFRDSCPWEAGEVISYQLPSETLILLVVLGHEEHANGVSPVCELLDWQGGTLPATEAIQRIGLRRGALPPEVLIQGLASTYPGYATNPTGMQQQLLADMGLIAQPDLSDGFDLRHIGAVTETIYRLQTGHRATKEKVEEFVRTRKPVLLEPVTQFSLRREKKKSELPSKRVQRLKTKRSPNQPLGAWLVIRWYELDEALRHTFGVK